MSSINEIKSAVSIFICIVYSCFILFDFFRLVFYPKQFVRFTNLIQNNCARYLSAQIELLLIKPMKSIASEV